VGFYPKPESNIQKLRTKKIDSIAENLRIVNNAVHSTLEHSDLAKMLAQLGLKKGDDKDAIIEKLWNCIEILKQQDLDEEEDADNEDPQTQPNQNSHTIHYSHSHVDIITSSPDNSQYPHSQDKLKQNNTTEHSIESNNTASDDETQDSENNEHAQPIMFPPDASPRDRGISFLLERYGRTEKQEKELEKMEKELEDMDERDRGKIIMQNFIQNSEQGSLNTILNERKRMKARHLRLQTPKEELEKKYLITKSIPSYSDSADFERELKQFEGKKEEKEKEEMEKRKEKIRKSIPGYSNAIHQQFALDHFLDSPPLSPNLSSSHSSPSLRHSDGSHHSSSIFQKLFQKEEESKKQVKRTINLRKSRSVGQFYIPALSKLSSQKSSTDPQLNPLPHSDPNSSYKSSKKKEKEEGEEKGSSKREGALPPFPPSHLSSSLPFPSLHSPLIPPPFPNSSPYADNTQFLDQSFGSDKEKGGVKYYEEEEEEGIPVISNPSLFPFSHSLPSLRSSTEGMAIKERSQEPERGPMSRSFGHVEGRMRRNTHEDRLSGDSSNKLVQTDTPNHPKHSTKSKSKKSSSKGKSKRKKGKRNSKRDSLKKRKKGKRNSKRDSLKKSEELDEVVVTRMARAPTNNIPNHCFLDSPSRIQERTFTPKLVVEDHWKIEYTDIKIEEMIGQGCFGVVYKAKWRHAPVVVKRLRRDVWKPEVMREFEHEAAILTKLRPHHNVVQFLGVSLQPPAIISEYLPGGDLLSLLHREEKLNIETKIDIALGAAAGLTHLHYEDILHCDLAARNLLVSSNVITGNYTVKVTDFGLSKTGGSTIASKSMTLPVKWMSPEAIHPKIRLLSKKSDVWSFGVVLWLFSLTEL